MENNENKNSPKNEAESDGEWEDNSSGSAAESCSDHDSEAEVVLEKVEEFKQTEEEAKFGCKHYRRRCQKKCAECDQFYTCRFCHDDVAYHNEFDLKKNHKMDRFKV